MLAGAPDLTPADEDSLQESTAHSYSPALLPAQTGENRGEVPTGGSQVWLFEGTAGERLSVQVQADYPANWDVRSDDEETPEDVLDTLLTITSPDGRVLTINLSNSKYVGQSDDIEAGINTDSAFDLIMTTDGTYRIEVSGKNYETSGSYTLYLATSPAPAETPPAD